MTDVPAHTHDSPPKNTPWSDPDERAAIRAIEGDAREQLLLGLLSDVLFVAQCAAEVADAGAEGHAARAQRRLAMLQLRHEPE